MLEIWRIAAGLGVPGLALATYYLLYRKLGQQWMFPRVPKGWVAPIIVIYLLAGASLVFYALHRWAPPVPRTIDLYHLRILVVDPDGSPVEDARVWSSVGGEAKKVEGGWELELAAAKRPEHGLITVYATKRDAYLSGRVDVNLGSTPYASATVRLSSDTTAIIRGMVTDQTGRSVAGVLVSVEGHSGQFILTSEQGEFELPAHAANGQPIYLRAEKDGYHLLRQIHPAGEELAYLILEKEYP